MFTFKRRRFIIKRAGTLAFQTGFCKIHRTGTKRVSGHLRKEVFFSFFFSRPFRRLPTKSLFPHIAETWKKTTAR